VTRFLSLGSVRDDAQHHTIETESGKVRVPIGEVVQISKVKAMKHYIAKSKYPSEPSKDIVLFGIPTETP
jgi:hypothetical protein